MKRNTWQREAVREALDETEGFISAQALHSSLHANGSPIGLATVYRALGDLASNGEADSLQSPEGEALYRACSTTGHHHHLICRNCGLTVEIAADEVETWAKRVAAEHGFTGAAHVVDVFGLCANCTQLLGAGPGAKRGREAEHERGLKGAGMGEEAARDETAAASRPEPSADSEPLRLRREAWGFAIGSLCFVAGALPFYAEWVGAVLVGVTFFVGSLFFTAAGFIQLSLSGRRPPRADSGFADRADWWSAAIQFVGTLCFNVSTGVALAAAIAQPDVIGAGWRPDAFGSIAFLVSSALAVGAARHRLLLWDPHARTWHGTWLNMVGSVAFAVSAVGAYVVPETGDFVSLLWANLGTLIGGLCFFTAAILSRRPLQRHERLIGPVFERDAA